MTRRRRSASRQRFTDTRLKSIEELIYLALPSAGAQPLLHLQRHRGADGDGRAIFIERHDDLARMQVQARASGTRRASIDAVSDDGPSHHGAMDAQLMGAAGVRFERKPSDILRSEVFQSAPQHAPGCGGRLTGRIVLHPPAARGVFAPQRHVDAPLVLRWAALDDGPVGLSDPPGFEQPAKFRQRLAMAAQHETARSIAIEAVRERRRARKPKTQCREIIFEALALLRCFRALMNGNACGLVDDQHQTVAIEQACHYLFFSHNGTGYHGACMSDTAEGKPTWWQRLSGGLKRTSASLGGAIGDIVAKRKLDPAMMEEIEDLLIRADLGMDCAARVAKAVGEGRYDKSITPDEVKSVLACEIEKVLSPVAKPIAVDTAKPFVALVVGVNGSGKTTTIGKLAARMREEGHSVMMVAGDTFRAAAIDQLKLWASRSGASILAREPGADPAGLAFDALVQARAAKTDVVLVDTAGRLQNKAVLMAELEKIVRVMKKVDASAPHAVLLVLDATVGQNALSQVEVFRDVAGVTGLVMTKLDGTARGGILVAIADKFGLPVHFVGVGEGIEDLAPFSAREFANAVAGVAST